MAVGLLKFGGTARVSLARPMRFVPASPPSPVAPIGVDHRAKHHRPREGGATFTVGSRPGFLTPTLGRAGGLRKSLTDRKEMFNNFLSPCKDWASGPSRTQARTV